MRGFLVHGTREYDPSRSPILRYQRACEYDAFVPQPIAGFTEPMSPELVSVTSEAEGFIRDLNADASPALKPLVRLLLRTESIASSRIEGLQVDAQALARAESRADAGSPIGPTATEILGNIDAMELAVAQAGAKPEFTVADIVEIHTALMQGPQNERLAGRIRTEQNWIGGNDCTPCGAAFVPPPPEYVPDLLADLCRAIEERTLPPLLQAALVHAQFETIHPFGDGNGRTGRALIHVVLKRRGLTPAYVPPISVQLARHKDRYIAGLTAFREGDVQEWVEEFCTAAARSAELAEAYVEDVVRLQDSWRARLRETVGPRSDAVAWRIIDVLPAHPVLSVATATAATGRTRAVVNDAMAHLEASGVLLRLSHGRRNRHWEAVGLLDLVAGLEAGESPGS